MSSSPGAGAYVSAFSRAAIKRRQIVAYDVPQDVEVNGIVTVNQPIAQTHDFGPRNVGMAEAFFGGYAACRFADDLKQPDKGKGSAGGHCRVRCEFSRRPLPLPPW